MARSNWLCEHCKAKGIVRVATIVNHIIRLEHGGKDIDENTENLCAECDEIATAAQVGRKPKATIGLDGWPA